MPAAKPSQKCPCPLCKSSGPVFVKPYLGSLAKCTRGHRFYVEWGTTTDRDLVLAVDADGRNRGERFPIPDDVEF